MKARARSWFALSAAATLVGLLAQPACARQGSGPEADLRAGRYDQAIAGFRRLAAQSTDPLVHRQLVQALSAVGRYQDAERAARAGATGSRLAIELANTLGEVLYGEGKLDEAAQAFRRAVAGRATDLQTARLNRARLAYDRGHHAAALDTFDTFIDLYNAGGPLTARDLTAVALAVRYLGVRDPELFKDALKAYDEAIAADSTADEPRLQLADLFLLKYKSPDAKATLREILARNPREPRALLELARAKNFDGSDSALVLVRKSLEVNPNLVPARAFYARLLLDLEDYRGAEKEARQALALNPVSPDALSALGATYYLEGDSARYREVERQVQALDPAAAGFYDTIAEMAVRQRRYQAAVQLARRAVALDSTAWDAYATLGLNELRVGEIARGRQDLETSFHGDPYNTWTYNTLELLDTFKDYRTETTRRFSFMLEKDEADLLFPYLAPLAEEAYDKLAARYGFKAPTPVRVEVYPRHADFSVRTVGLANLGALGVSFGSLLAMDSPHARERGHFNWGSTFWHELTHAFTLAATDHRIPRWLTEGLSVLEERRARPGWGQDVSLDFLVAYQQGRLLPPSRLNTGFVRPAYPEQVMHSYFEASLVAEMIEEQHGFQAVRDMLAGYRAGESTAAIVKDVLGTSMAGLDRTFDDWLKHRYAGPLAAIHAPSGRDQDAAGAHPTRQLAVRDDPGDFISQLRVGRQAFEAGDLSRARQHYERARDLFPEYTGPGNPYRALADIALKQGDTRAAATQLTKLTALSETDYQSNLDLANLLVQLGDRAGAAAALDRAIYIYPYDAQVHTRLASLYAGLHDWTGAVRERRALLALDPVDRADALYQLAHVYFQAGDRANARRQVLRCLELAPNFEKAQALLLQLQPGRTPPPTGGTP